MKKLNYKITLFILMLAITFSFYSCGDDTVNPVVPGGTSSDLTRSGKFIAFTSNLNGNYDIYLAQVSSTGALETTGLVYATNPFNLTLGSMSDDKQSNWSPDGRVLVFSRVEGLVEEVYAFFFNANGSIDSSISPNPKKLFTSGGNWDNNPSFSPSGSNLIWDRREDNNNSGGISTDDSRDLFIGDVSGSGSTFQVTNLRPIKNTGGGDEYNPKWSPRISVRKIAYEYQGSATSTDHDVYVIDPFDTTNNVNFYNPNNSGYPAWSPACDRIIFESDKSSGDFWKIVSLNYPANSGSPVDIAAESNVHLRYPTWLPNGGIIAYIKYTGNNGNIYVVSSNGGAPSKLLQSVPQFDAANNLWPAW
jgi:Tol biopolymer transport system component